MLAIVAIAFGIQGTFASVCESIRLDYKDSACCGDGGGTAFCTAPSFDSELLMTKIDNITALLLSSAPVLESPPLESPVLESPVEQTLSYPTTLANVCGIDAAEEKSDLNMYPPNGGDPLDYIDVSKSVLYEKVVKLDTDGNPTIETSSVHPAGFPAYFGACNSAKDSWGIAAAVCGAARATNLTSAEEFCSLTDKYAFLFSINLQLEYIATMSVPENSDFGSAYVESVYNDRVEFSGLPDVNPSNMTMTSLFQDTVDSMLNILNTEVCCETCPGLDGSCPLAGLFLAVVGPAGYAGHKNGGLSNAVSTVVNINSPLQTLMIEDYTTMRSPIGLRGKYPEYFDLCLASQRMFDYMLQNPYKRYSSKLSGSLNRMFRCSEPGAEILQAQSTILKWEYQVSSLHQNDKTKCPSPEAVGDLLDVVSLLISRSSEFQYGKVASLLDAIYTAPPTVTGTFWIPGNDVYQIQWYWINFIAVHINVLDTECNMTTFFKNPFGFGYKQTYNIQSEYFVSEYAKMSGWNDFKTSALKDSFVDVPSYAPYDPAVMNSQLFDYDGSEMTPFNDAYVSVRENRKMMSQYPLNVRYQNSETMYPSMQPGFDPIYKDCSSYDPTGYAQQFFGIPIPFDEGLSLAWFGVLANLPLSYTNFTVDGVTPCSADVLECVMKICDMRLGSGLNPANDHMPYEGDYATTKIFTGSYYMAPFCLKYNHSKTIQRCA